MRDLVRLVWLISFIIGAAWLAGCGQAPASLALSTETPIFTITPSAGSTATPALAITATFTTRISPVATTGFGTVVPISGTQTPFPTPAPTATIPFPSNVSPAALRYQLIDRFGDIFFCDPDFYPVAHEVSDQEIALRVTEIQKNSEEYQAILNHLGFQGNANFSPAQMRQIDAEHKRLNAIQLVPAGADFHFSLRVAKLPARGSAIEGVITASGVITVTKEEPTFAQCPICLAAGTRIDTPSGAIAVQDLRKGMAVWTANSAGARRGAVIVETIERALPKDVSLVHLVLDDRRELLVSAGHPSFEGRAIGALAVGQVLDGARVVSVELVPYTGGATYDLLPSGETGAYWANGILVGSTLHQSSSTVR